MSNRRLLKSPFTFLSPQRQFWTMILSLASFGYREEGLRGSHGFQVQVKGRAGTLAQRRDKQWWSPSVYCQVCAALLRQWSTTADLSLSAKHPDFFQSQDFFPTHCKIFHVLHQWLDQAQAPFRSEAETSTHGKQLQCKEPAQVSGSREKVWGRLSWVLQVSKRCTWIT